MILVKIVELQDPRNVLLCIEAKWHNTIKDIKDIINKRANIPPSRISLYPRYSPAQLRNNACLHDMVVHDDTTNELVLRYANSSSNCENSLQPLSDLAESNEVSLLSSVKNGLLSDKQPIKTELLDCTGGVYFLRDYSGSKAAVFKPCDEEQGMPFNNKGYTDSALRDHFQPGLGYIREYAAYCMDVEHRAQVPTTMLVQCKHKILNYSTSGNTATTTSSSPRAAMLSGLSSVSKCSINFCQARPKTGSLQQFIDNSSLFDDFGYSAFSDYEIQKIALFDMRILNCDRNGGNILVVKNHVYSRSRVGSTASDASGTGGGGVARRRSNSDLSFLTPPISNFSSQKTLSSSTATNTDCGFDFDSPDNAEEEDYYENDSGHTVLELIPIDHGYAFPSKLVINDYDWAWFHYPQLDKPVDPRLVEYLDSIDIDELICCLKLKVTLPEECWFLIRTVHKLLVEAIVHSHMTLKQVAQLIARLDEDVPSPLEKLIDEARENAARTMASRYDVRTSRNSISQPNAFSQRKWEQSTVELSSLAGAPITKLYSTTSATDYSRSKESLSSMFSLNSSLSFTTNSTSTPAESAKRACSVPTESIPLTAEHLSNVQLQHSVSEVDSGFPTPSVGSNRATSGIIGADDDDDAYGMGSGVSLDSPIATTKSKDTELDGTIDCAVSVLDQPFPMRPSSITTPPLYDVRSVSRHSDDEPIIEKNLNRNGNNPVDKSVSDTKHFPVTPERPRLQVVLPNVHSNLSQYSQASTTTSGPKTHSPSGLMYPQTAVKRNHSSPLRLARVISYSGFTDNSMTSLSANQIPLWQSSSEFSYLFRVFADRAIIKIVNKSLRSNSL